MPLSRLQPLASRSSRELTVEQQGARLSHVETVQHPSQAVAVLLKALLQAILTLARQGWQDGLGQDGGN
eukprot:3105086-Rhodomonas_salina.1